MKNRRAFVSLVIASATDAEPRHSEASLVRCGQDLLIAWSAFAAASRAPTGASAADREWNFSRDNNVAEIRMRRSSDDGRTWGGPTLLVTNDAGLNTMQPAFVALPEDELGLSYSSRDSPRRARRLFVKSSDRGQTWSSPVDMTGLDGYVTAAHHRLRMLTTGRLIQPCHELLHDELRVVITASDDLGETWTPLARLEVPTQPGSHQRGAWEASVCELSDRTLILVARTSEGQVYIARSSDAGATWSDLAPSGVVAPSASSIVELVDGDLLLVHNTGFDPDVMLAGRRNRLAVSRSSDGGHSWSSARTLFEDPDQWFHYPAMLVEEEALLALSVTNPVTRHWNLELSRIPRAALIGQP